MLTSHELCQLCTLPYEDDSEVVCNAGDNYAYGEERNGDQNERFTTEDMRECADNRLQNGRCEQVRCAGPESLDCRAIE